MPLLPAPLREVINDGDLAVRLPDVANPLGVAALAPVLQWLALVALVPVCIVGSALSLVGRYRRSRGQERLQLKWLVAAGAVTAAIYGVTMVLSLLFGGELWDDETAPAWLGVLQNVSIYAFVLIPVAIGVAVLRHRLYDIDLLIRRTLVYGVLTATLGMIYGGGVLGVSAVAGAVSGQQSNDLAVAASTLAVAGLFTPLRWT